MRPRLSDLWRWEGCLGRGAYLFWGILLFAIKFNIDRGIGRLWLDRSWTIFDPELMRLYLWQTLPAGADERYFLILLAASLPFLWAGLVLTLRRLRSIGWKPWCVFLFLIPVLKLFFFALLCLVPAQKGSGLSERPSQRPDSAPGNLTPATGMCSAMSAILATASGALVLIGLGTVVLRQYGWALFVGLPFCMGFLAVLIYSRHEPRSARACLAIANLTVLLAGLGLLLFAMEGFICILMAAPIALVLASVGGAVGYHVQRTLRRRDDPPKILCVAILAMPAAMGLEYSVPPALPLLEVRSSVVVNAPPEKVWRNVVSFSELPPPTELLFKLGVAYPVRAEIQGQGTGAIRYCHFSTGPFVEPIEVWDEPRLLRFSVTRNPEPMQEWTPYRSVHPPHLDGYLESRRGQFRLTRLDGGRTLLEGTTWYYHHLWPSGYWQVWSDLIIHKIHRRVLNHVKALSERNVP